MFLSPQVVNTDKHFSLYSLLVQHVPIPARTTLCRKGCCKVTWCPLEISWATTIHKFQGFEAGFDAKDMFRYLIVDPGDLKWEQTCPGALYVALSRAKTMGTFTSDTLFPRDSAIYWHGSGISTTRILEGHKKTAITKVIQKLNVFSSPRENVGFNIYNKRENKGRKGYLRHLPSKKLQRRNTLRSKYGSVLQI